MPEDRVTASQCVDTGINDVQVMQDNRTPERAKYAATFTHPNGYIEPVRIRRAARDYHCDECGARIAQGQMYGSAYVAFNWSFCMGCVEVADE